MFKLALSAFAAPLLALSPISDPAQAQPTRVFVAAQGLDSNPCTFALPCRTFQHAHDTVAAGGEIDVLDPAGYGSVIITKAISIQGHGFAGIAATSGSTGISVAAGASDNVNLRGLLLDGVGSGGIGISFTSSASLNVQECLIRNFASHGVFVGNINSKSLFISDSVIADNSGSDSNGVRLSPSGSGTVTAVLDRVVIENSGSRGIHVLGINSTGTLTVTVSNSTIANNGDYGVLSHSDTGKAATAVMVRSSTITGHTDTGLFAFGNNAVLRVTRSTVTTNVKGWDAQSGGVLSSYDDNNVDGNTTDGTPTSTILPK